MRINSNAGSEIGVSTRTDNLVSENQTSRAASQIKSVTQKNTAVGDRIVSPSKSNLLERVVFFQKILQFSSKSSRHLQMLTLVCATWFEKMRNLNEKYADAIFLKYFDLNAIIPHCYLTKKPEPTRLITLQDILEGESVCSNNDPDPISLNIPLKKLFLDHPELRKMEYFLQTSLSQKASDFHYYHINNSAIIYFLDYHRRHFVTKNRVVTENQLYNILNSNDGKIAAGFMVTKTSESAITNFFAIVQKIDPSLTLYKKILHEDYTNFFGFSSSRQQVHPIFWHAMISCKSHTIRVTRALYTVLNDRQYRWESAFKEFLEQAFLVMRTMIGCGSAEELKTLICQCQKVDQSSVQSFKSALLSYDASKLNFWGSYDDVNPNNLWKTVKTLLTACDSLGIDILLLFETELKENEIRAEDRSDIQSRLFSLLVFNQEEILKEQMLKRIEVLEKSGDGLHDQLACVEILKNHFSHDTAFIEKILYHENKTYFDRHRYRDGNSPMKFNTVLIPVNILAAMQYAIQQFESQNSGCKEKQESMRNAMQSYEGNFKREFEGSKMCRVTERDLDKLKQKGFVQSLKDFVKAAGMLTDTWHFFKPDTAKSLSTFLSMLCKATKTFYGIDDMGLFTDEKISTAVKSSAVSSI